MGIYLLVGDNIPKGVLIPYKFSNGERWCKLLPVDEPASHQLVGRVKVYQGIDG